MDVGGGNSHHSLNGNHHATVVFHTDELTFDTGKKTTRHTHTLAFTDGNSGMLQVNQFLLVTPGNRH